MDSFGTAYTAPLSSGQSGGLSRLLVRLPGSLRKWRDPLLRTPDKRRRP
jgi:hypothetical protein